VSSKLKSSLISYTVSYLVSDLVLGLVLDIKSVLDSGLGSLSILFIVKYQFFWYLRILSLDFCLVWGGVAIKVSLYNLVQFSGS